MKSLILRVLLALRIARPRRELFIVLKYGGKIYLRMSESQLRREVAAAGGTGVQFRDKSLVFQCYEFDPNAKKEEK